MHKERVFIVYHKNCMDGFASAVIAKNYFEDCNAAPNSHVKYDLIFEPRQYNDPVGLEGLTKDDKLYILDFSFKRDVMFDLIGTGAQITVLDHHKSAQQELMGLDLRARLANPASAIIFDMRRSGAGMAHDYFSSPGQKTFYPPVIAAIQDRDLWHDTLPGWETIRAVNSALFSMPYDLNGELAYSVMGNQITYERLAAEGEAIDRKHNKDCHELAQFAALVDWKLPSGRFFTVPFLNVPYIYASEVGNILARNAPFSVTYFDRAATRQYSLRSLKGPGEDVSKIAAEFGGGGHENAAGFIIRLDKVETGLRLPNNFYFQKV